MKRGILLVLALAVAITSFGCGAAERGAPRGPEPVMAPASPDSAQLKGASAVNAFGFDLMRARLAESTTATSNVVISPLSVHAALAMTLQGAKGQTAAEMQRVLHLPDGAASAAEAYTILLDALGDRSKAQTLSVANAIWVDDQLEVKREFLNSNRIAFGSAVKTLDFGSTNVAGVVNRWVDEQTHGMIRQIVQSIDPAVVMVLANAVYFKATWTEQFMHAATRPEPFHFASGQTSDVPTMHDTRQLPVVSGEGFSATKLAYIGGDSAAYLILPDKERKLDSVLSQLNAGDFAKLCKRVDSQPTTLTALALPKFDATVGAGLNETLKTMGMPTAFSRGQADFGAMADAPKGDIWIGDVIHKARMKVDEKETEAAAATAVMVCGAAAAVSDPPRPVPFVCDRPFALALVDTRSGAVLFLAAINDPTAK